jgi:hypothetical protein
MFTDPWIRVVKPPPALSRLAVVCRLVGRGNLDSPVKSDILAFRFKDRGDPT